jgi:hypothetical protein
MEKENGKEKYLLKPSNTRHQFPFCQSSSSEFPSGSPSFQHSIKIHQSTLGTSEMIELTNYLCSLTNGLIDSSSLLISLFILLKKKMILALLTKLGISFYSSPTSGQRTILF